MNGTLVIVSGGFDPIHVGHVRMIKQAQQIGDHLLIIVNNDIWLKDKKGYVFMPEQERVEILEALCASPGEDEVILSLHEEGFADRSVCKEIKLAGESYDGNIIFANGGDRLADNVPEVQLCKELGIEMIFNVGGKKIQSSSELVKKYKENK